MSRLLEGWRRRQGRGSTFLGDLGYTRAALSRFGDWPPEDLTAWCVEIDRGISAFAMAGRIRQDLGQFFIAKSDLGVRGLSEYLRWQVFRSMSDYDLVNDGGDLGLPGLRRHKLKFRPVGRIPVYTAVGRAKIRADI